MNLKKPKKQNFNLNIVNIISMENRNINQTVGAFNMIQPASVFETPTPTSAFHAKCVKPCIKIIEQPSAQRFRYECESRSAGAIPGVNSTADNKTFPTIEIEGYSGEVVIVVSCVTKDEPFLPHPHRLVGKDCKDGICTVILNPPLKVVFSNIGIQCVKKRDMKKELTHRMELKKMNPFGVNVGDMKYLSNIDLNIVRLCFEAFVKSSMGTKRLCTPVVSQPIIQKKSNLVICNLCSCAAKATGGDDLILLCNEVSKDDIKIRFFEQTKDGQLIWEDFANFQAQDVHKQTAIKFKTPRYQRQDISTSVKVCVQLVRPSDGSTSEAFPFEYYPNPDEYKRRRLNRTKSKDFNLLKYELNQYEQNERCVEYLNTDLKQTNSFMDYLKMEQNTLPQYFWTSNMLSSTAPSPLGLNTLEPQINDFIPSSLSRDVEMQQAYSLDNTIDTNMLPDVKKDAIGPVPNILHGFNYENMQINTYSTSGYVAPTPSLGAFDENKKMPQTFCEQQTKNPNDSLHAFSGLSDLVMELMNDPELENLS